MGNCVLGAQHLAGTWGAVGGLGTVTSKELVDGHRQPLQWVVKPHKWPGLATGDAG